MVLMMVFVVVVGVVKIVIIAKIKNKHKKIRKKNPLGGSVGSNDIQANPQQIT